MFIAIVKLDVSIGIGHLEKYERKVLIKIQSI